MNKRFFRNAFLFLAVISVVFLISFRIGQKSVEIESVASEGLDLSLMWKVKDRLTEKYLDKEKLDYFLAQYNICGRMLTNLEKSLIKTKR